MPAAPQSQPAPPPHIQAQLNALMMQPINPQSFNAEPSNPRILGLASNGSNQRHLLPVMKAGGWPMHTEATGPQIRGALVVVASRADELAAERAGASGTVLMEHGAGLSYVGADLAADSIWRGGRGAALKRKLFLAPGPEIAGRHEEVHPQIPVAIIGSPMLDRPATLVAGERPRVCLSSHWDCSNSGIPEVRSGWNELVADEAMIRRLAQSQHIELCGHWHPLETRNGKAKAKRAWMVKMGMTPLATWEEVAATCEVYLTDNSSTLYEFAALGRPVIAWSPSFYRRDVEHGLRFWKSIPGVHLEKAELLPDAIAEALADAPVLQRKRKAAVRACFGKLDGKAAQRGAKAILARFHELFSN